MHDVRIGKHTIGAAHAPFVIAEMSGNHNGSLDRAMQIVDAIADSGAHALKLQTYTADTMTIDLAEREFVITDKKSLWSGRSLYDLYTEAHTPWEWHGPIFERAGNRGLVAFSTPFDATAVEFLESLNVPCYKVASFENIDLALIRRVASTGKPLIISTGLATLQEISEAVATAREAGCQDLILLKCTSNYPDSPKDSHLRTMVHLRDAFGCEVGVSDHTLGIGAALAAVALGATVIEKHVTLSRSDGGVDSAFSLEPRELSDLVRESHIASQSVGSIHYGPTGGERDSLVFRRSLYVVADVKRGERLDAGNLRAIRPGLGLAPKYLSNVLGRRAAKDVSRGTPVSWDLID